MIDPGIIANQEINTDQVNGHNRKSIGSNIHALDIHALDIHALERQIARLETMIDVLIESINQERKENARLEGIIVELKVELKTQISRYEKSIKERANSIPETNNQCH